jgi:hypothetical protein
MLAFTVTNAFTMQAPEVNVTTVRSYTDLIVWQKAIELVIAVIA